MPFARPLIAGSCAVSPGRCHWCFALVSPSQSRAVSTHAPGGRTEQFVGPLPPPVHTQPFQPQEGRHVVQFRNGPAPLQHRSRLCLRYLHGFIGACGHAPGLGYSFPNYSLKVGVRATQNPKTSMFARVFGVLNLHWTPRSTITVISRRRPFQAHWRLHKGHFRCGLKWLRITRNNRGKFVIDT